MGGSRYLPLLIFQVILAVFFFVLVKYDGDRDHDIRGYEDTHVMIYIGFGFLMTFLKRYAYGALGINWLLAATVTQWSIITQGVFHMENMAIPLNKRLILEADIMSATVLITFGCLLGRATVGQLLIIGIIEVAIGSANIYMVGDIFQAADVGGAMCIHAYGAFFGLGVSTSWIKKKSRRTEGEVEEDDGHGHPLEGTTYINDVTAMIGSIFLFIYWPSFNSALAANDAEYQRSVVNTYLAITSCTVTAFVLSALVGHGKFEMEHIQNSTLAGGVGVGSICNMHITSGSAVLVGIGAAFISVFGFNRLKPYMIRKFGLLDTCGVMHLHGFPGVYSGLLSVIFAAVATESTYTKAGLYDVFGAVGEGRSISTQALYQLIALVATLIIAFVCGFITGCITKMSFFKPLKRADMFDDEKFWELP